MSARPEAILHLATEFTDTVLSLDGTEATVFEGILALALASEQALRLLQAAGKFNDEQIEAVREIIKKFSLGETPKKEESSSDPRPSWMDDYGGFRGF